MHNTEQIDTDQELKRIAQDIRDLQTKMGMSDAAMCKRFSHLGSTKTYKRILDGDTEETNVERQLHNYRQALHFVEMASANDQFEEKLFDDLSHVSRVRIAVSEAMTQRDNTRMVLVGGESGTGKSTTVEILRARWPKATCIVEADESWKTSFPGFLSDLIVALNPIERGEEKAEGDDEQKPAKNRSDEVLIPYGTPERKHKALQLLSRRKLILVIDEGHHMSLRVINFIKTIINRTETVVVVLAHPYLFRQLELKSFAETSQLTQNRLYERIQLDTPAAAEVMTFMKRREVKFPNDNDASAWAQKLSKESLGRGAWKFVNLVTRKLRKASVKGAIDQEQFVEALTAVIRTR